MFTRIAVALDGSSRDAEGIEYAAGLTRALSGALTLLHVHRIDHPGAKLESLPQYAFQRIAGYDDEADVRSLGKERSALGEAAVRLGNLYGIPVRSRVLRGEVVRALADVAGSGEIDLLVIASHGYHGAIRTRLHSVSDAVVRAGGAPVVLLRPEVGPATAERPRGDIRKILVALDGSPFSETIVAPVGELARALGAHVTLLRVAPVAGGDGMGGWTDPEEYLARVAVRLPITASAPSWRLIRSDVPATAIAEAASEGGFDLIAMATHGRGGLRHLFVGSVADAVLADSSVPVLVQRPAAAAVAAAAVDHAASTGDE
jgi:nucleotide-binding universal stress UspA family protein